MSPPPPLKSPFERLARSSSANSASRMPESLSLDTTSLKTTKPSVRNVECSASRSKLTFNLVPPLPLFEHQRARDEQGVRRGVRKHCVFEPSAPVAGDGVQRACNGAGEPAVVQDTERERRARERD